MVQNYKRQEELRKEEAHNAGKLLPKAKLLELVHQVDPHQTLDADVEELLPVTSPLSFSNRLSEDTNEDTDEDVPNLFLTGEVGIVRQRARARARACVRACRVLCSCMDSCWRLRGS